MAGISNLGELLKTMQPVLNPGEFVFISIRPEIEVPRIGIIGEFVEKEGKTIIMERERADHLELPYDFVASWITLSVHSSLSAVGFTAAFSEALAANSISCNVIAAYHHDHIFVSKNNEALAMRVLKSLADNHK